MSKSIYEKAIEKISVGFGGWDRAYRLDFVKQALKQAQKQKDLLEYYIELVETIEILERDYNYGLFKFNGIKYTYNKIKELEKELGWIVEPLKEEDNNDL